MNILNKPICSFTFSDIVDFCQERAREGIQLDYKRDLPQDGLSKYFAAFSNTRGGVIILGVEENRRTGIPQVWDGIPDNAQSIERIHQWASNVDPLPRYEVHATDSRNGKFFVLVRIFEGDRTPYYVQNDSKVYARTGNITPSIDLASPEMLELLFGKKNKAELLRSIDVNRSENVYSAGLRRAERERLKTILAEKEKHQRQNEEAITNGEQAKPYQSQYPLAELGSNVSMLTVLIQPFYPKEPLLTPQEIKNRIMEIRTGDRDFNLSFPALNPEPIQDGVMSFDWREDGELKNEQIYSVGLVRLSFDVLHVEDDGTKYIYIAHVASLLFQVLKAASNFYKMAGYQGGLRGYLLLTNLEGVTLKRRFLATQMFYSDDQGALMPRFRLDLDTDTSVLGDDKSFQDYFIGLVKEIYWSLGCLEITDELVRAYLKDKRWLIE